MVGNEKIKVDLDACTSCEICVKICPANALDMEETYPEMKRPEDCTLCGICQDQCPVEAIEVEGGEGIEFDVETVAEDPLMAELSDDIVSILDMEREPVGVKLIRNGSTPPQSFKTVTSPLRHCVSINAASLGAPLHLPTEMHACAAAKAALGMEDLPDKVRSGRVPYMHGLAASQEAAARIMADVPKLTHGTRGTMVAPLRSFSEAPDVVLLVVQPKQAMWVANALIFERGGPRITANFAGMQASCGDVTAIPTKTGEVNFTLGCYGCRSAGKLTDDEMYVGIPFTRLNDVVSGLKGLRRAIGKLEGTHGGSEGG